MCADAPTPLGQRACRLTTKVWCKRTECAESRGSASGKRGPTGTGRRAMRMPAWPLRRSLKVSCFRKRIFRERGRRIKRYGSLNFHPSLILSSCCFVPCSRAPRVHDRVERIALFLRSETSRSGVGMPSGLWETPTPARKRCVLVLGPAAHRPKIPERNDPWMTTRDARTLPPRARCCRVGGVGASLRAVSRACVNSLPGLSRASTARCVHIEARLVELGLQLPTLGSPKGSYARRARAKSKNNPRENHLETLSREYIYVALERLSPRVVTSRRLDDDDDARKIARARLSRNSCLV